MECIILGSQRGRIVVAICAVSTEMETGTERKTCILCLATDAGTSKMIEETVYFTLTTTGDGTQMRHTETARR